MVSEEAGQQLDPPDPSASGRPYRAHLPALPTWPLHFTLTSYWPPFSLPLFLCFYNKESTFYHCYWEEAEGRLERTASKCKLCSFLFPTWYPPWVEYEWTAQRLWEEKLKLKTKEITPILKPALVCSSSPLA